MLGDLKSPVTSRGLWIRSSRFRQFAVSFRLSFFMSESTPSFVSLGASGVNLFPGLLMVSSSSLPLASSSSLSLASSSNLSLACNLSLASSSSEQSLALSGTNVSVFS